jgi:hypothetical protein
VSIDGGGRHFRVLGRDADAFGIGHV